MTSKYFKKLDELLDKYGGREGLFKTDQGNYRMGILFHDQYVLRSKEQKEETQFHPIYNLRDYEYGGCIPLKKLYLEVADPTEYEFANKCLCNYDHFKALMETMYFKKFIDSCRDELELKLRSQAVMRIRDEALDNTGSSSINASKFLIERGWIGNKKEKEAIIRRSRQDKEINNAIEGDLKLIETKINER